MNTLEQKIDKLTEVGTLLLTEQIKINNRLGGIEEDISHLNGLKGEVNNLREEMMKGFKDMGEMINYIGNKVFDNHETRIKALETAGAS
jgi:hypothetical protein